MALTKEQTEKLKEGDILLFTTHYGYGKNHIHAKVKVDAIGPHGLLVEIIEIFSKGENVKYCEGAQTYAGFEELTKVKTSVTFEEAQKLGKGCPLIYSSGEPGSDNFIKAKVILVTIRRISCEIKITEILEIGATNTTKPGDQPIATYGELEIEPEPE